MKVTGKVWVFYNSVSSRQTKPMSTVQAQMTLLSLKTRDLKTLFIWTPGWESWQNLDTFLKSNQSFFVISQPPKPVVKPKPQEEVTVKDTSPTITKTVTATNTNTDPDTGYTKVVINEEPPEEIQDYGYYHQDFNGHDLNLSKIRKLPKMKMRTPRTGQSEDANRRIAIRHNLKIEVVIIAKEKTFRTYSKNISLGGTLLEDEIPQDFLNKPFELIIINRFETDPQKRRLLFKAKIVGDITDPRRLMFFGTDAQMMSNLDAMLKAYMTYQNQMKKKSS